MSGLPVTYGRNITTTPAGSGVTVDGLLIQDGYVILNKTPTMNTHAINKLYVDSAISGLTWKGAADAGTIGALTVLYDNGTAGVGATLTNNGAQAAFTTDGHAAIVGDRIVVKDQADMPQNGIYAVTNVGSGSTNWILTRAVDADNSPANELDKATVFIKNGTTLGGTAWTQTTSSVVLGVSNVVFVQFVNTGNSVIMDDSAATFPTAPATEGVWYGDNTQANTFDNTCVVIGNNASTAAAGAVAIGSGASATATGSIVIGQGGIAGTSGHIAIGTGVNSGTGSYNLMIGPNSGNSVMVGGGNIGLGRLVLGACTSGYFNTALGDSVLASNTTGSENTSIGFLSMQVKNSASRNTAVGAYALRGTSGGTGGADNTAVGVQSGTRTGSDNNTFVGYCAGNGVTSGGNNVAIGTGPLSTVNTGVNNICMGNTALGAVTGGADNVAIGYQAGITLIFGYYNTLIGNRADVATGYVNNAIAIGNTVSAATNEVKIGNATNTQFSLGGADALPRLYTPNNYNASLKGIPVGGLYRSAFNTPITSSPITSSFVATGTVLTVTVAPAPIVIGMELSGGTVAAGVYITGQLTGLTGGVGTYSTGISQTIGTTATSVNVAKTFAITSSFVATGTTLTVTVTAGIIKAGMFLSGGTVVAGTQITQQLTGTVGSTGTYTVDTPNLITIAPTDVNWSDTNPDILYMRTV